MAATNTDQRRQQVMTGDLPVDFLRVEGSPEQMQIAADHQTAAMLQAQQQGFSFAAPNASRISITVAQAKLAKNYGITKMDPYCRLRVGHSVFETHTAHNGGKNPRWNKVIHCHVPTGVDSLYLEIFDERAFTMDDRVAWTHIAIPERVFNGETIDDWYTLSGKQGEEKEGMVNLVLSYSKVQAPAAPIVYTTAQQPMVMVPGGAVPVVYPQQAVGAPVTVMQAGGYPQQMQQPQQPQQPEQPQQPQQPQQPPRPLFTEEDVKQVKEMFPDTEDAAIMSVLEANRGNKDATINCLLTMNS